MIKRLINLILILGIAISCSMPGPTKSKSYTFKLKHKEWKKVNPDKADNVFINNKTASIIVTNSICGRYNNVPLQEDLKSLLNGIDDLTVISSKENKFSDRDGLRTETQGKIDGVTISLSTQNVKKNNCTYDFTLIRTDKNNLNDMKFFDEFLNTIKIE